MILNARVARRAAKRRMPRVLFDDLKGGASGEAVLRRNCERSRALQLRRRALRDVGRRSLRTRLLGLDLAAPRRCLRGLQASPDFMPGLCPQFQRDQAFGLRAQTGADIIARDHQIRSRLVHTACLGMAGVDYAGGGFLH